MIGDLPPAFILPAKELVRPAAPYIIRARDLPSHLAMPLPGMPVMAAAAGGSSPEIFGTMGQASAGANGNARRYYGLQFTPTQSGIVTEARIGCGDSTGGVTYVAGVYTNNAGVPGTQVGSDSDSEAAAVADLVFNWSSGAPSLTGSTTYWLVVSRSSGSVTHDTCAEVMGVVTGCNNTLTAISDGTNMTAGRDARIGVMVTP